MSIPNRQGTSETAPRPLNELLTAAGLPPVRDGDAGVSGIVADSRQVRPGHLFIAYPGVAVDGHDHVPAAVAAGAVAVVAERPVGPLPVPLVLVPDGRLAWAHLAAAWEGFPSRRLRLAGVTGTDGKTTTATLLHHILTAAGIETGLVSTVGAHIGAEVLDTGLHTSTPPPPQVQGLLARMLAAGCGAAVFEATSEGLGQRRLAGCEFDLAIITNITHDHLYYHRTFAAYRDAKAELVRYLFAAPPKPGVPKLAVLNRDDPSYAYLAAIAGGAHLAYGRDEGDVTFAIEDEGALSLTLSLRTPWGTAPVRAPMSGAYNAYNTAAAVAGACAWGVDLEAAAAAVASFAGVPGRLEFVRLGQPFNVVVDFAHTENSLVQVLTNARRWTRGRLIVVFGCAGERDVLKRRPMARAAVQLADLALFTAEDPRREDIHAILAEMEEGAREVGGERGRHYLLVPDRREAVFEAVRLARPDDTVLLCGKGHERSMCYGTEERPWSDRAAAEDALRALRWG